MKMDVGFVEDVFLILGIQIFVTSVQIKDIFQGLIQMKKQDFGKLLN